MQFDDRLGTVLRSAARSEAAARTQFRQLVDLLGSMPPDAGGELVEAAYDRLAELAERLPATEQSKILRSLDLRLRNRALVARLAQGEPQVAAAAMATARLSESDWLHLIPRLPLTARGFLRHRRDLPASARQVLDRLGVRDLVLPMPAWEDRAPAPEPEPAPEPARETGEPGIGDLVRRIEAFQKARREGQAAPRLPLGELYQSRRGAPAAQFDFSTGSEGRIERADPALAPLAVGLRLSDAVDPASARRLARHLPLSDATARLDGPEAIAGEWRLDAAPAFDPAGRFSGYRGRMRRRPPAGTAPARVDPSADRMRQVLHELRTPVGAIQGFAEIIQQQLFGPAPNEYRALAAGIAVDAARLLAGFDEIDRLARLESGAVALAEGACDFRHVVSRLLQRLEGVLRPRSARMVLAASGSPFDVNLAETDALQLAWRLLATLAGSLAPGEVIDLDLSGDGSRVRLRAELPLALGAEDDPFAAAAPAQQRAVSAGMFGTGFTLRLARAEARAAGGRLLVEEEAIVLDLPALTSEAPTAHSAEA